MALVKFETAPGAPVAVRAEDVFYAKADTAAGKTRIAWDGPKFVVVVGELDDVARKLGQGFIEVEYVDVTPARYFVNKVAVVQVTPQPGAAGVCALSARNTKFPARGDFATLVARLA